MFQRKIISRHRVCLSCRTATASIGPSCHNCGNAFIPTENDRQRIFQEESLRLEVQQQIKSRNRFRRLAFGVLFISFLCLAYYANRGEMDRWVERDHLVSASTGCYLEPTAVFDTKDDVTLYAISVINGDSFSANNMLSGQFHFWLTEKAAVRVLYHGPYQGYVAPDAPQRTRDALSRFEICEIQILDGAYKDRIGWAVDNDLRCRTQRGK
jgi:hypothetical protein